MRPFSVQVHLQQQATKQHSDQDESEDHAQTEPALAVTARVAHYGEVRAGLVKSLSFCVNISFFKSFLNNPSFRDKI